MKRLLIIEDEPDFAAYIRELVRGHYEVTYVDTRVAAETVARTEQFDAVMLDLTLPDSTPDQSLALAAKLAAHQGSAPLIIVSAHPDLKRITSAAAEVADGILYKPDLPERPDLLLDMLNRAEPTTCANALARNSSIMSILGLLPAHR